jgi:hypothetical protein
MKILSIVLFALISSNVYAQRSGGFNSLVLDDNAGSNLYLTTFGGGLGINQTNAAPNPCAILDLNTTTQGVLLPRLTTAQRNLLCPIPGMLIYNSETNLFEYYLGAEWSQVASHETSWLVEGNANIDVDGIDNIFGTLASSPIHPYEFRVGGTRIMRYDQNNNIIGGGDGNKIFPGVVNGVISGGGNGGSFQPNYVFVSMGTVSGGEHNQAGKFGMDPLDGAGSTVSGGAVNFAVGGFSTISGGLENNTHDKFTTIGGGEHNQAGNLSGIGGESPYATVAGGTKNFAHGAGSFIGGGGYNGVNSPGNVAAGTATVIGGGAGNHAFGEVSAIVGGGANRVYSFGGFVGGGINNQVGIDALSSITTSFGAVVSGEFNHSTAGGSFIGSGYRNNASAEFAFIGSGKENTASGIGSVIVGGGFDGSSTGGNTTLAALSFIGTGSSNMIESDGTYSIIVGGRENNINETFSFIGGGAFNQTLDVGAIVVGGSNNRAGDTTGTTLTQTFGAVVGGFRNTAHGGNSFVGSGAHNTAAGQYFTSIVGGSNNLASGDWSFIGSGEGNHTTADFASVTGGRDAVASHYGESAQSSGMFTDRGDAQTSVYTVRTMTTDGSPTQAFLDGQGIRITIPIGSTYAFSARIAGTTSGAGSSAGYEVRGLIKNNAGTTSIVGAVVQTILGEDVPAWDGTVVADDGNDALAVQVTGEAGATIRWVARVETAQVSFP